MWNEKIKKIIEFNKESRILKETMNNELNKIKKTELREVIEGIWKNEILLNWQNYWDPINK